MEEQFNNALLDFLVERVPDNPTTIVEYTEHVITASCECCPLAWEVCFTYLNSRGATKEYYYDRPFSAVIKQIMEDDRQ